MKGLEHLNSEQTFINSKDFLNITTIWTKNFVIL